MTFAVNRPLTDQERAKRLLQRQRLDVQETDDLSVIRFNSTYLEIVDKWFGLRGVLTIVAIFGLGLGIWINAIFWIPSPAAQTGTFDDLPWALLMLSITAPFFWLVVFFLKCDAFRYTHYPIRLNRKTQMVHVFRVDGTVLSAPWKDLFFCIESLPQNNYVIQGHVLDIDGVTVKETFAFPVTGTGAVDRDELPRYWEFIRRYMEEGPQPVAKHVEYCLPIANQRESFSFGFHRMHSWASVAPFPIMIWMLLIYLGSYPGRWLAMRTSKIPLWPKEIEESCVIELNDPFRKDASMNKPITDHSLIYLVAAIGTGLLVWAWW